MLVFRVAALALLVTTAACAKSARDPERPAAGAGDAARLQAPALFAHVPANTPYFIGSFEALPIEYFGRLKQAFAPLWSNAKVRANWEARGNGHLYDVISAELGSKLDVASFEALGLSARPRFAIYGLGVMPLVARVEIRDAKVLRASIERIAREVGATLPTLQSRDGREFWQFDSDGTTFVIALQEREAVVAVGTPTRVSAELPRILGIDMPASSMAGGKPLIELMTRYGIGPHSVGYVDVRQLAADLIALAGDGVDPACADVVTQLAARVPRVVVGSRFSSKQFFAKTLLELPPDLRAAVASVRREVPGFEEALGGRPVFAFGAALDLDKGAQLVARAAEAIATAEQACGLEEDATKARAFAAGVPGAIPAPFRRLTGAAAALYSLEAGSDRKLAKLDGFAMVTAVDAPQLYSFVKPLVPPQLALEPTGELAQLPLPPGEVPFDLYAGLGPKALVVGTGSTGREHAERVLRARTQAPAPLLTFLYDYGRIFELVGEMEKLGKDSKDDSAEFMRDIGKVFGLASFGVDVDDAGLASWFSIELK